MSGASPAAAQPLSRADWRFLLPSPAGGRFRHLVLLGGPGGLDQRIRELAVAERVETVVSSDGATDALILLAGSRVAPSALGRSLAPDAVVYWEIDRRPSVARSRWIARELRTAGLDELTAYWITPDFGSARRYLPLRSSHAIDWFMGTRFVAATPVRVVLDRLLAVSGGSSHRVVRGLGPHLAIVATTAGRTPTRPVALAGGVLSGSEPLNADLVLLTSGQDDGSRVVALPFGEAEAAPQVVIKMSRLRGFTGRSEREQATLEHLRARLPAGLGESLPSPLGALDRCGSRAFFESVVPGRMLAASVGRWRAPARLQVEDLRRATEWLCEFHRATQVDSLTWDARVADSWVLRPLAAYEREFGLRPGEGALFALMRARAAELAGHRLPVVLTHNDFNPWHVYRSGDRIGVIDWEFVGEDVSERQGLPLCDLIYFVTHWFNLANGLRRERDQLKGFRDLFLRPRRRDGRRDAAHAALLAYARALAIVPAFLPMLIVSTWVERAIDRHRRRLALEPGPLDPRSDNRFARYVELLAAKSDELFSGHRAWAKVP